MSVAIKGSYEHVLRGVEMIEISDLQINHKIDLRCFGCGKMIAKANIMVDGDSIKIHREFVHINTGAGIKVLRHYRCRDKTSYKLMEYEGWVQK